VSVHDCPLCRRLKSPPPGQSPLVSGRATVVYEGPFSAQWPGHLMLVSRRHVVEQTDLRSAVAREAFLEVLDAERAVRRVTGCDRVNVVKLGNAARHLHWHIVPRYLEERHPALTPWEILQAHPSLKAASAPARSEEVYGVRSDGNWPAQGLRLAREELLARLAEECAMAVEEREPGIFGAAIFLRAADRARRAESAALSLEDLLAAMRAAPSAWESFLMRRNYLDRAWDHFGGNGDAGEFPEETVRREVGEELGWRLGDMREVTRQWRHGLLSGFLYLARPEGGRGEGPLGAETFDWTADTPWRISCDEVAEARWFNLVALAEGRAGIPLGPEVTGRHRAVMTGAADFRVAGG
jgi:diadenosine tetraphosphate (Ap4A) HIT family hydrolase/8-oxo-dGTP pyrophosphatase MutT (NUDIX family)